LNEFIIGAGASIFTGALTYAVFSVLDALSLGLRVAVAFVLAFVALAATVIAIRRRRKPAEGGGVVVGDGITAKDDVKVDDVKVQTGSGASVATNIRSDRGVHVSGVHVTRDDASG
jgi:membrane protein implicated in regulation of membrane protease activity